LGASSQRRSSQLFTRAREIQKRVIPPARFSNERRDSFSTDSLGLRRLSGGLRLTDRLSLTADQFPDRRGELRPTGTHPPPGGREHRFDTFFAGNNPRLARRLRGSIHLPAHTPLPTTRGPGTSSTRAHESRNARHGRSRFRPQASPGTIAAAGFALHAARRISGYHPIFADRFGRMRTSKRPDSLAALIRTVPAWHPRLFVTVVPLSTRRPIPGTTIAKDSKSLFPFRAAAPRIAPRRGFVSGDGSRIAAAILVRLWYERSSRRHLTHGRGIDTNNRAS